MIDFSNCKIDPLRTYDGANGSKICIFYNGDRYMLKFPPKVKQNKAMSYTNGCKSEYIASKICASTGIPTHETILGTYHVNGKEKIVVACKDFCQEDEETVSFARIKNTCIDSEHGGFGTELSSVLEAIDSQVLMDNQIVLKRFWEMFAIDALLGNFDRHNGNWAFLINKHTGNVSLAPIYDNGSCLYPQLEEDGMRKVMSSPKEINDRIFVFPNSALKIKDKKINYFEFLMTTNNKDCLRNFANMYNRIDMDKILSIVEQSPFSNIEKEFYVMMVTARKQHLMDKVMDRILKDKVLDE